MINHDRIELSLEAVKGVVLCLEMELKSIESKIESVKAERSKLAGHVDEFKSKLYDSEKGTTQ